MNTNGTTGFDLSHISGLDPEQPSGTVNQHKLVKLCKTEIRVESVCYGTEMHGMRGYFHPLYGQLASHCVSEPNFRREGSFKEPI